MAPDDPEDEPTRSLAAARRTPRIVLGDDEDERPTVSLHNRGSGKSAASAAGLVEAAPAAPEPALPVVTIEPGHVVTRRITGPRRSPSPDEARPAAAEIELPVGWLTAVSGPGRGRFAALFHGMNSLGRDESNRVAMPWGDDEISRKEHCYITYDDEQAAFWIQHGGKSNLVRVNDAPVLAPVQLRSGDTIRIGQSRLRFVALCDEAFNWITSP